MVLSGALDDGSSGLWAIKHMGGVAIVQDPQDAAYGSMPVHALRRADVDYIAPAADIGPLLDTLVRAPLREEPAHAGRFSVRLKKEIAVSAGEAPLQSKRHGSRPSRYACPVCHGATYEINDGRQRFRCHTGHGHSAGALITNAENGSEDSLWSAVRTIQEAMGLLRDLARSLEGAGQTPAALELRLRAEQAIRKLDALREITPGKAGVPPDGPQPP